MKYLILTISILALTSYILDKDSLYLLYSPNIEEIKRGYIGNDHWITYVYEIYSNGEKHETIALSELHPKKRDTVSIRKLSKLNVKDIHWLTKSYFDYFKGKNPRVDSDGTLRVFNLNNLYKAIYIVLPDSTKGTAVITQVTYDPYFSID